MDAFLQNFLDWPLLVDSLPALLGTGLNGPARGAFLEAIRWINTGFPEAKIVAVDIPSGLASDTGNRLGESVRADYTVTFTATVNGVTTSTAPIPFTVQ